MNNYEWIKSMSEDELAFLLEDISRCSRCKRRGNSCFPMPMSDWLKAEHKDKTNKNDTN